MKFRAFCLFTFCLTGLLMLSCESGKQDEETLLLYAKATSVYREGRYTEAASMLLGERAFAPSLVLRGKAHYFAGNDDEAEKSLRRALALSPGNTEAGLYLARLGRERGNLKDAKQIIEKILSNDPQNIRALRLAAEMARDTGPQGEAMAAAYLDQAAEASSELALVFLDRARSRWVNGNVKASLEDLGRARALLPLNSPLLRSVDTLESIISELGAKL
ncbi:MAG: tetratricopeptide repeat protein [Treponema sp.]|jgi:predicted Zn-dependent protease|nr:tetratricopeptide repeat protein [Treponema sp.]